ncbi:MAG: tRNA pseudouridine(38-40) synthase TruA [Saprospiraceae bacterium]|nr:tRNA pseudouridine(38-40) synthase TruA [Bacteroidia bacterium]NNE16072.1 tRNA pseudouridine(38-40) synthase TruA [Saprospiraceae bacterium]NNL91243.1 tRNA pseudouridine(38-40) synthase TruA [Saprospiraceae bacterium]
MHRYFAEIAYKGTEFSGWQIQPNAPTVQEVIELQLTKLTGSLAGIVGCGRTDAGVHASQYFFHFDIDNSNLDSNKLCYQLNATLPESIAVKKVLPVKEDAHARFDATQRSYVYKLHGNKNPFLKDTSFKFNQFKNINFKQLNTAAQLLLKYEDFFPFCKTKTEVETFKCAMSRSEWVRVDELNLEYHVSANRFLRGMVRLIVGMCLNVSLGKLKLEEVKSALDNQTRLETAWSVPAEGLYLNKIVYPYFD